MHGNRWRQSSGPPQQHLATCLRSRCWRGEQGMTGSSANPAWIWDLWALGCKLAPCGFAWFAKSRGRARGDAGEPWQRYSLAFPLSDEPVRPHSKATISVVMSKSFTVAVALSEGSDFQSCWFPSLWLFPRGSLPVCLSSDWDSSAVGGDGCVGTCGCLELLLSLLQQLLCKDH